LPHDPLVPLRRDRSDHADSPLARALKQHVDGEVGFDRGTRALYATDASNYRQVPIGVVIPRTIDAMIAAVELCREHDAPIVPRGGGTSLAGQTCNEAIVIDTSRHLTDVEVDRDRGIARVEPGAIMSSLRKAANAVELDFGPDPSTKDRCTLGGMLGNNSCGVHSVQSEFYGPGPRTSDHVIELDVLTYRGRRFPARAGGDGAPGDLVAELHALRDRYEPLIRTKFPDMPRRVSGYNLPDLLDDRGFHLGRALVGTEATCALFLGATLQLMPMQHNKVLALLGYPDIYRAAEAANVARSQRPVGCEALDHVLVRRIRDQHRDHDHALAMLPDGCAWLLIEHCGESVAAAVAKCEQTIRLLAPQGSRIISDDGDQQKLADVREQALGVDAFERGKPDNYEGWEDSAVPPANLAAYLRELHALYDQYGLEGSLYGHFAHGCVHTRIDFGLDTREGVERYRRFTFDAAKLVVAHGGSLSGEHGDGQSKADLHEIMFGPELVQAFREFKTIFDPDRKLNPGKLVWPNPRTSQLRLVDYRPDPGPIDMSHGADGKDFGHAAVRCVGIGKCRKRDAGAMCPSYMATLDERHSTRGRAHLLFEMMRGDVLDDGWHSDAVVESLDLCLACKACKKECPTHVDMASYKAEFNAHHYAGRVRPKEAYLFGWLHRWLGLAQPLAPLANFVTHAPGLRSLAKWIAGMPSDREIPKLAHHSFRSTFEPGASGDRRVILWPDTFNDAFHPDVLHAAALVLTRAGFSVEIPAQRLCCGRPLYEYGFLDDARALWRDTFEVLGSAIADGVPVVGLEPSCTSAFRDELPSLFPDDPRAAKLATQTYSLGELLAKVDFAPASSATKHVLYHRHCHQAAVLDPEREIAIMRAAGHQVDVLDSGCCGLAGAFGFQKAKYPISVALAERVLLPAVRNAPDATLVTDGFSCREQVRQLGGIRAIHIAELLAESLR
jgi:FAD/FMN-containing dehydrogenase/Fe-S oxidoreductase